MDPRMQVVLSGTLTFGVPLLLALRELLVLRRDGRGAGGPGGHGPGERRPLPPRPDGQSSSPRLPACLLPPMPIAQPARSPAPAERPRVLEPA